MNVLICDGLDTEAVKQIESTGHTVTLRKGIPAEELLQLVKTQDIIVVRSATKVTRAVVEAATQLKVVIRAGVGLDNVDAEACESRHVRVLNTPAATSISVAEHTLGLMLALARHIPQGYASIKRGEWDRKSYMGTELFGKTCGIVGFGRIGQEVAKRARAFGMRVLAHDVAINSKAATDAGAEVVGFDQLLASSDYLTLHLPLIPSTKNLVGAEQITRMKKGARLINAGRGGIVDEEALAQAISDGHIAGAALDVFAKEPPEKGNPLLELPQVIAVPHLGASTHEGQQRAGLEVARLILELNK